MQIPLGLVAGSIVLSMLVAELVLRLFYPCPYYGHGKLQPGSELFEYDPTLGWRGRPHAVAVQAGDDFVVLVKHDDNGFRNTAPPYAPGKRNILVLGDSHTWGWGVKDDEVFSSRMMKIDKQVNVYNLGAPGYGTDQEYLTLLRFLEKNPDYHYEDLVLVFCGNDFFDVGPGASAKKAKSRFVFGEDGDLKLVDFPVPEPLLSAVHLGNRKHGRPDRSVFNASHLFNLVTMASAALKNHPYMKQEETSPTEVGRLGYLIVCELTRKIASIAEREGMRFHIVFILNTNVNRKMWQWDAFREFLKTDGIEFSEYRSRRFPSTDLWLDRHLSRSGQRLLAKHILQALRAKH